MTEAPTPNTIPGRDTEEDIAWLEGQRWPYPNTNDQDRVHNARIDRLIAMARSRSDEKLVEAYATVIDPELFRNVALQKITLSDQLIETDCRRNEDYIWNIRYQSVLKKARACIALNNKGDVSPGLGQPSVDVTSRDPERPVWVGQEEPNGCVAATLAMVLGLDYRSAVVLLGKPADDGCYSTLRQYQTLWRQGWRTMPVGRIRDESRQLIEAYPPEPFADMHIVSVRVSDSSPVYHSVLWLRDGTVLDPLTSCPKRLSDYHHVGGIYGLYAAGQTAPEGANGPNEARSERTASDISRAELNTPDPRVGELIKAAREIHTAILGPLVAGGDGQTRVVSHPSGAQLNRLNAALDAFGE